MKHFYAQQEGGVVIDADDLPDTIRWEDVAEQVGSRTHHQCRYSTSPDHRAFLPMNALYKSKNKG